MAERPPAGLYAVVVAYGRPDLLEICLATLDGSVPVVVVDNGSSPGTKAVAERHGGTYLDPGGNLGFAAGVNRAVSALTAASEAHDVPDILLVNPDAAVTPPSIDFLRRVLASDSDLAAVAPSQRRPGGTGLDRVCWPFPTPSGMWRQALGIGRGVRQCEFLIGSVLLLRGAALADLGGFDERFFLYSEEIDWQRRVTLAGWRVRYCPNVVASHVGAATDDDRSRRELRFHVGNERYIRKWFGPWGWRSYRLAHVVGALVRVVVLRGEGRELARGRLRIYLTGPDRLARRRGVVPEACPIVPRFAPWPEAVRQGTSSHGLPSRSMPARTLARRRRRRAGRPLLIDAGALGRNTKGVARVLQEVVPRMVALDPARYLVACSTDGAARLLPTVPVGHLVFAPFRSQSVWEQWTLPALGTRLGTGATFSHQECGALWGPPLLLHVPEDPEIRWHREPAVTVRERARRLYSRTMMDRSLARAQVVASTEATAGDLCRHHGVDRGSLCVVPLGVDLARFQPTPPSGVVPGAQYFFHLASGDPRDHTEAIIDAFASTESARTGAFLVVAGDMGAERARLAVRADRAGVASQVTFAGRVSDEELASLYSNALATVHASLDEGFGLQPLEAMACGALLIAAPAPATVEVVGAVEVIWSEPSAAGLATAMDSAAANASRRERAHLVNRERAGSFTWDETAERLHGMLVGLAG